MNLKKQIIFKLFLIGCLLLLFKLASTPTVNENPTVDNDEIIVFEDNFSVHMIDVGQADSILIQNDDDFMLIDAGNRGDSEVIRDYLSELNVNDLVLDYFIGTHPHEDHIGSAAGVIYGYKPENILLPERIAETKVFEEMLLAIKDTEREITVPKVNQEFSFGDDSFVVLSPDKEKDDTNNNSIVIIYTHTNPNGDTKWLFMGDAETEIEEELLNSGFDLKADVLKAGHHGSNTSSSKEFVEAVDPEIVLVSAGAGNKYGHPHDEIIKLFEDLEISCLRTDLKGTIVLGINDTGEIYER